MRESVLIRGAVERHLTAPDDALTAYDLAKRAGLIAAIADAPRDLSTNPKHFAGFGKS